MSQALIERARAKLRSALTHEAAVFWPGSSTRDLEDMLDAMEAIQPVLEEAGIFSTASLQKARSAAYKIIDMVDELQDHAATMTRVLLPGLAIKRRRSIIKLKELKKEVTELELELELNIARQPLPVIFDRWEFLEEASVIGRRSDKQRILAVLLSAASNITQGPISCTILPIFGLRGSGKTTLARMVFMDDTHSLQEYNFRAWVHVSPKLDFHRIGKSILRQVEPGGGKEEEINYYSPKPDTEGIFSKRAARPRHQSEEGMERRLRKLLNGTKMLLVLDDLWEEDPIQLQLLKSMFTSWGGKVDVIVTTYNQAIARKICTVEPYRLNPLDDEPCWEIIKKSMDYFDEEDKKLEMIGRQIARKCQGLPAAAQAYAKVMSYLGPTRWEEAMRPDLCDILSHHTLSNEDDGRTDLFAIRPYHTLSNFKLSYGSMPPDLGLCIGYFAILPNGQHIVKHDLIYQWIALSFIGPSGRSSATEIAEGYITRLLDMSFLQTTKSDPASGSDGKCAAMFTMHYLADAISRNISEIIESVCLHYMLVTNCHGKLDDRYDDDLMALRCVGCRKVDFNEDSFSRKKFLRVLELKESNVLKLPDSICKLRHLGYLKISEFSGLITLPESFGDLTNLFYIDLSGCSGLAALPESFGELISLSHLNLSRCHGLTELPKPLQKLGKLVYLDLSFWSCFKGIGEGLGGLTNLEHLNLSHPCCHLAQQRTYLNGLKDGLCKLTTLRYLNLSMCLNPIFYCKSEEDSLEYIESCVSSLSSLEHLDLSHNTFLFELPPSLGGFNKLHTLNLSGCIRLKRVGEIKSLKFIALRNCRGLESCDFQVHVDDYAPYISSNIVQLEDVNCQELQISGLEKVRSKEEAEKIKLVEKQKLGKLKLSWTLDSLRSAEDRALLEDSILLGALLPPPSLQCLEVNFYNGTCLPEYLSDLTSLRKIKIVCCKQLNSLPDSIQKLTNLKDLCILECPKLEKWCQLEETEKILGHILNISNEEHGSTSRPEIEEDCRSTEGA